MMMTSEEFLRRLVALVAEYEGPMQLGGKAEDAGPACPLCRLSPLVASATIATSGGRANALMAIAMHAKVSSFMATKGRKP